MRHSQELELMGRLELKLCCLPGSFVSRKCCGSGVGAAGSARRRHSRPWVTLRMGRLGHWCPGCTCEGLVRLIAFTQSLSFLQSPSFSCICFPHFPWLVCCHLHSSGGIFAQPHKGQPGQPAHTEPPLRPNCPNQPDCPIGAGAQSETLKQAPQQVA